MTDDELKRFLEVEYAKGIAFYDRRANSAKCLYRFFSCYLIIVSSSLAVIASIAPQIEYWKYALAGLSASISIVAAFLGHFKFHENWLSYRSTWDAMERERRLFQAGVGYYNNPKTRGEFFVMQIEAIRAREGDDFYSRHSKVDEKLNEPAKPKPRVQKPGE